jgi:hypothetical protein
MDKYVGGGSAPQTAADNTIATNPMNADIANLDKPNNVRSLFMDMPGFLVCVTMKTVIPGAQTER